MTAYSLIDKEKFLRDITQKSALFFSEDQLSKITHCTVAQAGFGGIGACVLELLARWGIGKFRLLDMDTYDISNINRQIFATSATVGKMKAEIAAQRLLEINPHAKIEKILCAPLTHKNAEEFISGASVIVNGIDLPSGQLPLHFYAKRHRIPVVNPHCENVTGAAVEIFDYRLHEQQSLDEPTRNKFINHLLHKYLGLFRFDEHSLSEENLERADKRFKKTEGQTLNFVTNLAGCVAAAEVIKLLSGKGKRILYPRQIYIDPFKLKFGIRSVYNLKRVLGYIKERMLKR